MYLLETVVTHPYSDKWPRKVDHTFFWGIPEWVQKRKKRDDIAVLIDNADYQLAARLCDEVTGLLKRKEDDRFDEYATISAKGYIIEFWMYKFEDPYDPIMLKLMLAHNAHNEKMEWENRFPMGHYVEVELDSGETFFASIKEYNVTHAFRVWASFAGMKHGWGSQGKHETYWTVNFNHAYKKMTEWRELENCKFCTIEAFQFIGYFGDK